MLSEAIKRLDEMTDELRKLSLMIDDRLDEKSEEDMNQKAVLKLSSDIEQLETVYQNMELFETLFKL